MIALWIGLGVIVAALVTWRLRKASTTLDRIMSEELSRRDSSPDPSPDPEVREAEYRNQ